jgi:nucleoside-triphosphatase
MTPKNIIIAGNRCVGKTALVKSLAEAYPDFFGGFYTEETPGGVLVIKTLGGAERAFASKNAADLAGGRVVKLKKYRIDPDALEDVAVPAADESVKSKKITILDEIGSMDVLCEAFRIGVLRWLASESRVLAAILPKSRLFTDDIAKRPDCRTLYLTRNNYRKIRTETARLLGLPRR